MTISEEITAFECNQKTIIHISQLSGLFFPLHFDKNQNKIWILQFHQDYLILL